MKYPAERVLTVYRKFKSSRRTVGWPESRILRVFYSMLRHSRSYSMALTYALTTEHFLKGKH